MMNVLLIGGTGFISSSLVRNLVGQCHRVTLVNRGKTASAFTAPVERLVADRTDPSELEGALAGRTFDVVYDMVAYRPEESAAAARLLRGKTGRFVHCSTVSVYMISNQIRCPVTEDQDKAPVMAFWPRNPFGMGYGILKRQCEDVLWNAHDDRVFPVRMLRPTFVSGPRDPTGRDFFWIERILDGGPLLVPGTGEHRFQQVYVEDVARMLVELGTSPGSGGKVFNIAGEETFTLNEYLERLCALLKRTPEIVHVEQETFDALPFSLSPSGDVFPFNTQRDAFFSLDRIRRETGYRSTPFDDWMAQTIDWWQTAAHGHSNGYERRAEEIAFLNSYKHVSPQDGKGTTA